MWNYSKNSSAKINILLLILMTYVLVLVSNLFYLFLSFFLFFSPCRATSKKYLRLFRCDTILRECTSSVSELKENSKNRILKMNMSLRPSVINYSLDRNLIKLNDDIFIIRLQFLDMNCAILFHLETWIVGMTSGCSRIAIEYSKISSITFVINSEFVFSSLSNKQKFCFFLWSILYVNFRRNRLVSNKMNRIFFIRYNGRFYYRRRTL